MPPTKRALLIANPGEQGADNYAKGVYVDVRNYHRFLTSPEGGAWETGDIESMDRPTRGEVQLKIAEFARYDYTFVMFSGHGWYSSVDNDRTLELRKDERVSSRELLLHAKKRTLILDCCLVVHHEPMLEKMGRMALFANQAGFRRAPNREACRKLFLKEVENAPIGYVRISSCAIDERSWDDDNTGGRYNSSLMGCAEAWAEKQAQNPWVTDAVLNIAEAHEAAAAVTRRESNGVQNPTIEKAKSGPYFPFAVFA
jgi:caspase domain-containing protein